MPSAAQLRAQVLLADDYFVGVRSRTPWALKKTFYRPLRLIYHDFFRESHLTVHIPSQKKVRSLNERYVKLKSPMKHLDLRSEAFEYFYV